MKEYYFTFGSGQEYAGYYVKVTATDYSEAREKMIEKYGIKWSFQYDSPEKAGIDRWGYRLLEQIK